MSGRLMFGKTVALEADHGHFARICSSECNMMLARDNDDAWINQDFHLKHR
jgi:hypothetical protein